MHGPLLNRWWGECLLEKISDEEMQAAVDRPTESTEVGGRVNWEIVRDAPTTVGPSPKNSQWEIVQPRSRSIQYLTQLDHIRSEMTF